MKNLNISLSFLLIVLLSVSCNKKGGTRLKSMVTGSTFEVLVVIDDKDYRSVAGEELFGLLNGEVPALPQPEPLFKIIRIPHTGFSERYANYRNIIWVETGDKFALTKATFIKDPWAASQKMIKLVAPSDEKLASLIKERGEQIIQYFYTAERERTISLFQKYNNKEAKKLAREQFGIDIAVPLNMTYSNRENDFLWLSNNSGEIRQDVVIYSFPYKGEELTYDFVLSKRDSVFKAHIPGPDKDSYLTTEYRFIPPVGKTVTLNTGEEAYEVRGLWRVENGTVMGGPFINLTRIDTENNRIIAVEGFVFAPSKTKRNPIQQSEAMVYSTVHTNNSEKQNLNNNYDK